MLEYKHLDHYTENIAGITFDMVYIEGDTFVCGDGAFNNTCQAMHVPDFWIGETVVTQEIWEGIIGENPSEFINPHLPVECVSWYDIQHLFLPKLNELALQNNTPCLYTLPTEPCWEYAAQADEDYIYSGSNEIQEVAWYKDNSREKPHTIKTKEPNKFGLYDMSGNVWEWTNTIMAKDSYDITIKDIKIVDDKTTITFRGGAWTSLATWCNIRFRNGNLPFHKKNDVGFRLFSFVK